MKYLFKIKGMMFFIVGITAILFALFLFLITFDKDKKSNNPINTSDIKMLNMNDDYVEIIKTTAEKNVDWSNLPLSKKFLKKYKSKYGILGKKVNYTFIDSSSYMSNKDEQIVILFVWDNAKEDKYKIHYFINENNELDDVEIIDKKLLYDEHGNEIVYKSTMKDAYTWCITLLAAPGRLEYDPFERIYVTDNYLRKWSAGFIDYNISCGITPLDIISNENKRIVYLDVIQDKFDEESNIIGNEWEKYFKVHYYTDENAWLDDVEVEEISKEEIDKLLNEKNSY